MTRSRWPGRILALAAALPFGVLILRSVAATWRAPAIIPQRFSLRAAEVAATGSTGRAVVNSLVVAGLTTAAATIVGWPAARMLGGRIARLRWLFLVLLLPLLVPGFATGTGLATWMLRLGLADTLLGIGLSHLVVVLPYVVLVLAPAFTSEVAALEEAGATLGARPWQRIAHVTIPAVAPTLGAAVLLGFVVSWSQYGTSLAVGGGVPMLPLVLVPFVRTDPQVAAALGLVFLLPPVAALLVATVAARRSGRLVA